MGMVEMVGGGDELDRFQRGQPCYQALSGDDETYQAVRTHGIGRAQAEGRVLHFLSDWDAPVIRSSA